MTDALLNFSYSTVATAPSPALSGTSLVVATGDGVKFTVGNAVIWPANAQPSSANAEIIRVTAISTDTFTITRTQENSANQSVSVGSQIQQGVTAGLLAQYKGGPSAFESLILAASPTAWWKLSDSEAESAPQDSSGNGRNLSKGSTVLGYNPVMGRGSAVFNNTSMSNTYILPTGNFSVSMLFMLSSSSGPNTLFSDDDPTGSPNQGIRIYQNGGTAAIEVMVGTGSTWHEANTTGSITKGIWHLLNSTYDGTSLRTYLDGVLCNTTLVSAHTAGRYSSCLGQQQSGLNNPLYGSLSQVALFTSVLTPAQITNLWGSFVIGHWN